MHAFLSHRQRSYRIPPGDLVRIGSAETCDIQLPGDSFISRQHCSVSLLDGKLTIVDLHSTHGTLVNDEEVGEQPVSLRDGDCVRIGNCSLLVSLTND